MKTTDEIIGGNKPEEDDEKRGAIIIRNVPETTHRELKARAAREGKSINAVVLEMIANYTQKEGEK